MKKLAALLMAAVVVAGVFAGCGGKDEKDETKAATSKTETDTKAETDAKTDTEGAKETAGGTETKDASDSDMAYVKDKGKLVVGITEFEPMDYQNESGEWVGFDADMAKAFAESLGVEVEFVEIVWDNKILELDGKSIDCVWNGMTLTDEVTSAMECSKPYCQNAQTVIVPTDKAEQYQEEASLSELTFAVEAGSAGEAEAKTRELNYTPVSQQSDALMEVAAGTSDAAIIDSLMAGAMVGEGTGYADLTYTVSLNGEEYGVGFRKGSDLAEALNQFFAESYADGSMLKCAETYGVQAAIIEQ
ncbi:MAG: transporter substrate-binding domain-containing protein [Lachnospiraceae bacterium]|nr:transporter substrate-binding domain-containing protein [Lachnospiraceae bacterium]